MLHTDPARPKSLGADIRTLRRARGLTLADLSDSLGRSVGWLSQVERDLSTPDIDDLRQLAGILGVPLSMFLGHSSAEVGEDGVIVRAGARRPIGSAEAGLVEELLSPDLTDAFEVVHSTFRPGSALKGPVARPTQEVGYIVSGKLDLTIGAQSFTVGPGDAFRVRGEPMSWANPYREDAVAVWVIAPPVY